MGLDVERVGGAVQLMYTDSATVGMCDVAYKTSQTKTY
jgi:hypothetical protein